MSHRRERKRINRRRRQTRNQLVHAAGCVFRDCALVQVALEPEVTAEDLAWYEGMRPIGVPRSLRHIHGRVLPPATNQRIQEPPT